MNTMTNSTHETEIVADPSLPTIKITREFDAPAERVYRAYTDPELFVQWIGPRSVDTRIDHWDARTGGGYRYASVRDDFEACFYGSFHEVRPNERLVQTFTFEGAPDGVSLETMTFVDLPDGRCRLVGLAVVDSMELRDLIMSSGMDVGVLEGYAKLDELLARG
ncbi:SRPBCC family protein [Nocardioides sp.]|jgi:uncharacterized protein YndB with AHSA1/START domain|uniref:SRPBCC family protein n=1 Tax=Nocardioides sp. TaxID=35761 RepID=UPI0031FE5F7E|nr:putative glutathione S-transferase-related transrane protein [Nocardioides sp.]